MKVLVTGGTGFIGSNLAKRLAEQHEVVVADNFYSGDWRNLISFPGDVLTCDVSGDHSLIERAGPFDCIFHQASITDTTVTDQRFMMVNNVEAFRALLKLAARWNSRVVWASSASIFGNTQPPMKESAPPQPLNAYAYSKLAMERLARRFAIESKQPIVGLRYFNVYGPGEDHKGKFASMIHQLAKQMRAGKRPRVFTAGEQKRDFVHVDDCVQANLLAMQADRSGVYNVGSGEAGSFNDVIAALNQTLGTQLAPDYFENPFSFTQDWTQADLTLIGKEFGYKRRYDLRSGIASYGESGALGVSNQ